MKDKIVRIIAEGIKHNELSVDGAEAKYEIRIISDEFDGKSVIQRHKLVYALLNNYIKTGEIHALTIKAMTVSESKK